MEIAKEMEAEVPEFERVDQSGSKKGIKLWDASAVNIAMG